MQNAGTLSDEQSRTNYDICKWVRWSQPIQYPDNEIRDNFGMDMENSQEEDFNVIRFRILLRSSIIPEDDELCKIWNIIEIAMNRAGYDIQIQNSQ